MQNKRKKPQYELTVKQKRYLVIKRVVDLIISTGAIIILSPMMAGIAIAIKLDSEGTVLFKQRRVGKNKELFEIYKFRTMKSDAPGDKATHLLEDPDQYITKIGAFLRRTSLDELPQLFNIWKGEMYLISTRPALWNQYDLIEERDKYGIHKLAPGLTGWAQINGRDELEISVKVRFDREYIQKLGFWMDVKCFLGTIGSIICHDGVIEGGTGRMNKGRIDTLAADSQKTINKKIILGGAVFTGGVVAGMSMFKAVAECFAKDKIKQNKIEGINKWKSPGGISVLPGLIYTAYVNVKRNVMLKDNASKDFCNDCMEDEFFKNSSFAARKEKNVLRPKKVLITGANSYIGKSVEDWLNAENNKAGSMLYQITTLDMRQQAWREHDFSMYDAVFHVAGIAHADVGKISQERKRLYYEVNTDLAVETAEKAKKAGAKQFIFMSSMIVYSGCKEKLITGKVTPTPLNVYGDSKWQADKKIRKLSDKNYRIVVVRPPMIYGKGSKGNYQELSKLAAKLPVFPIVKNKRSMLHVDNLCHFIKLMIDNEESGVFFPQNREYVNTSDMLQMIAAAKGHPVLMIPFTNLPVKLLGKVPGRIGTLAAKAFGDSVYEMSMSEYKEDYRINTLRESIRLTECVEE